ncbi:MAG: hypothetical protein FJ088_14275, partial [Deltaproteobacteria bacterium]|nr:hypothetical protein [Deltaproteobacteria bacterium]
TLSTSKTGIKGLLLSVHEDTNSNASLFVDGEVAFASAEERYTRNKFQGGFPKISVERALKFAAKSLNEVDSFVAGNRIHFLPRILPGYLPEKEHDFFSPLQKGYLYYHHILSKIPAAGDAISAINRALLNLRLRSVKPIVDHHTAHAYSAYFTSGFDSAAAISMDNMGDGYSTKVFQCSGGKCGFLWGSSAVCSPGQFYGAITQLLGFHCLMAGKTTGLAASGNPSKAYGVMEKIFGLAGNRRDFYLYPLYKSSRDGKYYKELKENFKPADIAAAAQKRLEDAVCGYVEEALKETGSENVVLAGGVFGNVRLNQKIFQLPGVKNIFVHPAMSDQGISLGAAYYYMSGEGLKPSRLRDVYWGDGFGDGEIHAALEEAGVEFSEEKDIEKRVAELLVQGKVVARFKGRMEYGPRALGNRSILYRPDDPTV